MAATVGYQPTTGQIAEELKRVMAATVGFQLAITNDVNGRCTSDVACRISSPGQKMKCVRARDGRDCKCRFKVDNLMSRPSRALTHFWRRILNAHLHRPLMAATVGCLALRPIFNGAAALEYRQILFVLLYALNLSNFSLILEPSVEVSGI